jgi:hypothetical protein
VVRLAGAGVGLAETAEAGSGPTRPRPPRHCVPVPRWRPEERRASVRGGTCQANASAVPRHHRSRAATRPRHHQGTRYAGCSNCTASALNVVAYPNLLRNKRIGCCCCIYLFCMLNFYGQVKFR